MKSDDEGFEFVDKRRTSSAEPCGDAEPLTDDAVCAQQDEDASSSSEPSPGEAEDAGQMTFDVPSLLGYMLGLRGSAAWQWMGVVVNPATGGADTDLAQARLAIDTFEAVAGKLMPHLDEMGQREVRGALADLRMNYVERGSGSAGGRS